MPYLRTKIMKNQKFFTVYSVDFVFILAMMRQKDSNEREGGGMRFLLLIAVFLFWIKPAEAQIKVVDGDSLFIGKREIRLSGIDAPEYKQECFDANGAAYACGKRALSALKALVKDDLECKTLTTDRYHREVAVCYSGGKNVNRQMVLQGWAVAYDRYTHAYDKAQNKAKRAKRGIWQGRFMKPELYRALMRRDKKAARLKKN